jgi:hypothetical protein
MSSSKLGVSLHLHIARLLYLSTVVLLFYMIFNARSGEVYTVWRVLDYSFIILFLASTFLLLLVLFSSERVEYKIFFTILHSILSHTFMVIIFPAGNVGVQQMLLGRTRPIYDNIIPHAYGWTLESILGKMYALVRGVNFQASFSVILARMFSVDIYWVHLLLVPLLWGIFVPIIAFMVTKALGVNEKISALSSLIVSLFPANILWGAVSIPNGLSYIFFFCFILFLLKYMKSSEVQYLFLIATFFLASFLSHVLAGTMALSLISLAYGIKTYQREKDNSLASARFTLLTAFIFSASLLPFALALRRYFYPSANTYFSLEKLYRLTPIETLFSLLFGSYSELISREAYITTLIFGIAPLIGLIGMIYVLRTNGKKSRKRSVDPRILLLFLGFLMIVVDDRIVKFFMANVPFVEFERLWLFRDFLLVSFAALFIAGTLLETRAFLEKVSKKIFLAWRKASIHTFSRIPSRFTRGHLAKRISIGSMFAYVLILLPVSGWVTASVYYAYPHWAPLQTTSYEIEAVKFIEQNTTERYVVICDQWMILAGQMFVGIKDPQAYYFPSTDPEGVALFVKMKNDPANQTMIEAMKINNATTVYFIIEKPRLGAEKYSRIIQQAQQNDIQTYKTFYYKGEEKLRIFYYKRNFGLGCIFVGEGKYMNCCVCVINDGVGWIHV